MKFYPIAGYQAIGRPRDVRAVIDRAANGGRPGPVPAGAWYLSGAVPEAYRATADLPGPYRRVRLVRVVERLVEELVEELGDDGRSRWSA